MTPALMLPTYYRSSGSSSHLGSFLLHAALWSMVRRVIYLVPMPVVLVVVALVAVYVVARWLVPSHSRRS